MFDKPAEKVWRRCRGAAARAAFWLVLSVRDAARGESHPRMGEYRALIRHKWGADRPPDGASTSENPGILGIRACPGGGESENERGDISRNDISRGEQFGSFITCCTRTNREGGRSLKTLDTPRGDSYSKRCGRLPLAAGS